MSRPLLKWVAVLQIGLVFFTGCHPTQPFFVARDESRADYIMQSMDIEYADVQTESLPEAAQSQTPLGPGVEPTGFIDLSLEDAVSMALNNTKIMRVVNGSNTQSGSVAAQGLSAQPGTLPSIYDPGVVATTANSQPLAVDNQGNRIISRGLIRSNQVGGVEDALSEFDAQFSALMGYSTTDRPRNVGPGNVFNPQFFQAVDSNAQAALSKRLATGTVATARFSTIYSRNNIPAPGLGRFVPSDYTAVLQAQITQPLLRGRGTLVNRIPIVLARINEDIELHRFEGNVRNLVKSVEDAYWDLYCGYRAFEAAKIAQSSALNLWRVAQARTSLGDTPPEAEAQARALYYQFTAQLHSSLYGSRVPGNDPLGLYGREQVLREKIGWGPTDGQLIRPADDPTVARVKFEWNDIQAEALCRNTELRQHKWAIKQRELELILAKNQILPQLDASLTASWIGVGDHFAAADRRGINFPNPGSTALDELTGGDYQEYSAQLSYTPQAIGKRRALANIQNAELQLKKFNIELEEKEIYLMHELTRVYRELETGYVQMKDYLDQWLANEDEVRIYNDRIEGDAGELGQLLDNVLRAEERRSRAELLYYQSVCEYNKTMVNVHYLKGSLLDLNNIALAEGPWVDKAYWDAEERAAERASGFYMDYGYTRPGVVSRGPVVSGTVTEGNISTPGFTAPEPAREELPTPEAEEGGEEDEFFLPRRKAPTARRSGPGVMQAAATQRASDAIWGDMGLGVDKVGEARSDPPAPIIDDGSARRLDAAPQRTRAIPTSSRRGASARLTDG